MEDNKKNLEDSIEKESTKNNENSDLDEKYSDDIEGKLKSEIEELKNQLLRLQADFVNYRNRIEREKSNSIILANEGLILKMLPVLDNFNRAFNHLNVEDDSIKGFVMIKEQFETILKTEMLEEIESDGAVFDPNLHNAVMTESREGIESGIILETFEKGYKIKDKIIRPSMVKVSE